MGSCRTPLLLSPRLLPMLSLCSRMQELVTTMTFMPAWHGLLRFHGLLTSLQPVEVSPLTVGHHASTATEACPAQSEMKPWALLVLASTPHSSLLCPFVAYRGMVVRALGSLETILALSAPVCGTDHCLGVVSGTQVPLALFSG